MTFLRRPGTISIEVTVSSGVASSVAVKANRPPGLTRIFVGRRPEEAPTLARQVFSLCGFSQSVASRLAVLNAADLSMGEGERVAAATGLYAERIFETLRALILHWPSPLPSELAPVAGRCLRRALAASQEIIGQASSGKINRQQLASAVARLCFAARAIGISDPGDMPLPGSACAAMLRDIVNNRVFADRPLDALTVEDDQEVIFRLSDEPDYSNLPHLPGRVVETGAYARRPAWGAASGSHLARRFLARIGDVGYCLGQLKAVADTGEHDWVTLACGAPTPGAGGYGAVECARGRLYHQAEIGGDGRLSAYRILAPTEWNFHPAGPFVDTLLRSRIGSDDSAPRSVSLLAVLFDPCVAFDVGIREADDA
ncbi:nickel-dependent hydrogenase large subunit [Sinorhizobium americanum]|uniref:Hydrogenase expression/formation protein HupK n=1 Tax=Sinorhizobium americanum TaxID=194963 RepID=A0A1L3LU14_9HYPH|nr:nickel-dependent hydrogenase large subunit [Sinorhizobium americanum]APG93584.1 hydrogenase expression/formation protein HupK [Sinorhizobium americanum]OAP44007.1 hydrogenase assembly protein HupF [Sinorhizobium americanum]